MAVLRRARVALIMGFALVFSFAIVMQLVADLVAWMTHTRVSFLFPLGLTSAFVDLNHLASIVSGLAAVSLVMAVILFWRMTAVERGSGTFDIHDR
ncbi:MAG: hypothetical protein ACFB6R_00960 [Alphaproteobacteria bacterium]